MESLEGTPNVMQCSYLNIPYAKIKNVKPNNAAVRETGLPVDLDFSNLTSLGNNKYLIGVTLDLGTQIDVSTIIDSYNSYLSGTSTYKPTVIYVLNGNSYKLIEGIYPRGWYDKEGSHDGLCLDHYCHCTSALRRAADIVVEHALEVCYDKEPTEEELQKLQEEIEKRAQQINSKQGPIEWFLKDYQRVYRRR